MKVYSLSGKSGTGKSFQAINLCTEKDIESIIDDGLFIYKNRVEAGISAKRQKTAVGAIKTAIFNRDDHAEEVREKIKELKPESILIIGTSDGMIDKIVKRLELPPVDERIYIEDLTTEEERAIARNSRDINGEHIIPVPTPQLRRDFAGYFLDPMKIFRERTMRRKPQLTEKTVVRPTFSYMGDFFISDSVFTDIAVCVAEEFGDSIEIAGVYENTSPDTLVLEVSVDAERGKDIWNRTQSFQHRFRDVVQSMTAYNVVEVDISVRKFI